MMAQPEHEPLLGAGDRNSSGGPADAEDYMSSVKHTYISPARRQTRRFLSSKYGHYAVLLLVTVDVTCIFADFLISLYVCDLACKRGKYVSKDFAKAQDALSIVSLVFSCLFMLELLASIWAFGVKYFYSWFHWLDALIILSSFVIDVCLKGVLEEVGSVIVILRFWRVFKIVEEFSAGASDQMDALNEKIEMLEQENQDLRKRVAVFRPEGNAE